MRYRIAAIVTIFGLSLGVASCDKCGDFQQIRVPGQSKSCRDAAAR